MSRVIETLRAGGSACGTMLRMVRNPAVATVARHAGLDFIMLDMEHGPYSFDAVSDIATVARAGGLCVMARVPELHRGYVSRALDCGIDAVMVPMLETVEQARKLALWSKYPPMGGRGLGSMGGNTDFTTPPPAAPFMADANVRTMAIAQIETVTGVKNAAEIARVEGIDVLLVGPNDLANSLGKPGDLKCAEMDAAIERIADAARDAGKVFGFHGGLDLLERWAPHGLKMFMYSLDTNVLESGFKAIGQQTRRIAEQAQRRAHVAQPVSRA